MTVALRTRFRLASSGPRVRFLGGNSDASRLPGSETYEHALALVRLQWSRGRLSRIHSIHTASFSDKRTTNFSRSASVRARGRSIWSRILNPTERAMTIAALISASGPPRVSARSRSVLRSQMDGNHKDGPPLAVMKSSLTNRRASFDYRPTDEGVPTATAFLKPQFRPQAERPGFPTAQVHVQRRLGRAC